MPSIVWQSCEKNAEVTGTWQKAAFQCSVTGDLPVSSATGYHQLTHCTSNEEGSGGCSGGGRSTPLFPELLVGVPTDVLLQPRGDEHQPPRRRHLIPGIPGALDAALPGLSSLDAYVAVYNLEGAKPPARIRFCFQFCKCIHDAEAPPLPASQSVRSIEGSGSTGRGGVFPAAGPFNVPVEVGLFAFDEVAQGPPPLSGSVVPGDSIGIQNRLVGQDARVLPGGGTAADRRRGNMQSPIKRVKMKNVCCLNLRNASTTTPYVAVFSLCVARQHGCAGVGADAAAGSGNGRGVGDGPRHGCLVLHVFPSNATHSQVVARAVRSERRLGPLLHTLCECCLLYTSPSPRDRG